MNTHSNPQQPATLQQKLAWHLFDVSTGVSEAGRELLETGSLDPTTIRTQLRKLAAAYHAVSLGLTDGAGESDADLAREALRHPYRMRDTVIP
jgi:hypothetical protein